MDQKSVEPKEREGEDGWMEGGVEEVGGRGEERECFVMRAGSNDLRIT